MIRIHAVPPEQLWALIQLERNNQGFDELVEKPQFSLIKGRARIRRASRLQNGTLAERLRLVTP